MTKKFETTGHCCDCNCNQEQITSKNYVDEVLRTESVDMEAIGERLQDKETVRLLHAALGLVTEASELADILKKHIFYGKLLDRVHVREEVGDGLWYAGVAIDVLRTTMDEVMSGNISKLKQRYPEKFTEDAAINRDTDAERSILEGEQ
jgi:NTP pyrophosphatase (non-canonical NTP hydrolase)